MPASKSVLITDLDNTLFDLVDIWYHSFRAMLDEIVIISGIAEDKLIPEIRQVHQKHGTSEYAFLIEELPSIAGALSREDILLKYGPAMDAYRDARTEYMKLYDGVASSLAALKEAGVLLVGYTESMAFYTGYRMRKLNLDGLLQVLFSPPDHDLPENLDIHAIRKYPASTYDLKQTKHRHTPKGELKPNKKVLLDIIRSIGAEIGDCVYIGDSLFKDVAMARDATVLDVWAKYGIAQQRPAYELLRAVTHWTDADVEREKQVRQRDVVPSHTLESGFHELLNFVRFGKFNA